MFKFRTGGKLMLTSEQIKKDWKEEREWYQNPDTNLWLRLGDFVRLGDCVSLGDSVRLGDCVRLGDNVSLGDFVRLGDNVSLGDCVSLGDFVRLGDCVSLGDCVRLGDNGRLGDCVSLGDYVRLVSINHEYVGTLVVDKSGVEIRIGCEVHSAAQWDLHGKKLAEKHNESAWWEATGKYMLELLKVEALNIEKELKKGQEVS